MSTEFLYGVSQSLVVAVMLVLLVVSAEIGYRTGTRALSRIGNLANSQHSSIYGGIVGLLALLLGFTFSMSLSRFDVRRQLVVNEANAIGTTYLRANLLPEPEREEITGLLKQYVGLRLDFFRAGIDQEQLNVVMDQTEQLQNQLWLQVSKVLAKDDRPSTTGLFIQSLNEVIDLSSERFSAMQNHVPQSILILLFVVAVISLLVVGYGCGLSQSRHFFSTTILAILLVLVIGVIMDLDRPRRGLIQVSQESMLRLRDSLSK